MRWSLHIARIAGIDVKIHFTFFLLPAFLGAQFYLQGGPAAALFIVIFICVLFLCVLLHEFGHAIAARRYGIETPDITLLPIGGVARLERMPDEPAQELVVALAGPAVNVVIAALLFPFVDLKANPIALENFGPALVLWLFSTNIGLVLFNLVPAFPMDGGRVLRALLAMRMDYARATSIAATIGQCIAITGGLYGLFHGREMLALVAIFVFFGAQSEASLAQMKSISAGLRVSAAMVTRFEALPLTATLHDAVDAVLHTSQHDFPILDNKGDVCGVLTRDDLIVALRKSGAETPVSEVMRVGIPSILPTMMLDRAFTIMQKNESRALPVVDRLGRLVGLFTPENVGELMMIQSAIADSPRIVTPVRPATPPPLPST